MKVFYDREEDAYICREQVDNQTIELGMNCSYESNDRTTFWNIYLSIFNKKKDIYDNMDKHIITGKNPFQTFAKAREMFYAVEAEVLKQELLLKYNAPEKIVIYCTWVDNRRRDAYYKVLSKMGYTWGRTPIMKQKCIMKVYKREDLNKEIEI